MKDYAKQEWLKPKRNYRTEALGATAYALAFFVAIWFILELTA